MHLLGQYEYDTTAMTSSEIFPIILGEMLPRRGSSWESSGYLIAEGKDDHMLHGSVRIGVDRTWGQFGRHAVRTFYVRRDARVASWFVSNSLRETSGKMCRRHGSERDNRGPEQSIRARVMVRSGLRPYHEVSTFPGGSIGGPRIWLPVSPLAPSLQNAPTEKQLAHLSWGLSGGDDMFYNGRSRDRCYGVIAMTSTQFEGSNRRMHP